MAVHITVDGPSSQPRFFRRQVVRIVAWYLLASSDSLFTEPTFSFCIKRSNSIRREWTIQWLIKLFHKSNFVHHRKHEGTSEAGYVLLKHYHRESDGILKTRQIFSPYVTFFYCHCQFYFIWSPLLSAIFSPLSDSLPLSSISSGSNRRRTDDHPRRRRDHRRSEPARLRRQR